VEVTSHPGFTAADVEYRAGIAASDLGQMSQAAAHFQAAITSLSEFADDDLSSAGEISVGSRRGWLLARVLLSSALPEFELGDVVHGLDALDRAKQVANQVRAADLAVLIDCQRGVLLLRSGRPMDALPHLNSAVGALGDARTVEQVKILMNRGDAHHLLGHLSAARNDFRRALDIARAEGLVDLAFESTHNLGFMDYLAGDLPQALATMPGLEQAPSDYARGVVGLDRAKVLISAGLFNEAESTLTQAAQALARTDLAQLLADVELQRAEVALRAGRRNLARELAISAGARTRTRGNDRTAALADLALLKVDRLEAGDVGGLVEHADRTAVLLASHQLRDESRLARLIAIEGSQSTPTPRSTAGLSAQRGEGIDVRLQLRLLRSRVAVAEDRGGAAVRECRRGLDELANYQARFGSIDMQASASAYGTDLAVLAISEELRNGRPTAVFSWLERARAISGRIPAVQPPEDEETARLLGQLRWVVHQLEEHLDTTGATPDQLRRQRAHLEQRIRSRSWTLQGPRAVNAVPRTSRIRAGLGDATLLTIFWLGAELYGLTLTQRQARVQRLTTVRAAEELLRRTNADADALAVGTLPESLRAVVGASLRQSHGRLDEVLLRPLRLPDGPVVLLPPARLAGLPWGQLPTLAGRPVTVAPTASVWLAAQQRTAPGRTGMVAVAGPGLARADQEVAGVVGHWPGGVTLTGQQATGEAVLAAIDGVRLVHVAAHGRHQQESPLFSSIRLADGPVVGYDLDRVPRPPQHVVLSACDLGQATVRPGDEALGLTRALLHSGTATVVAGVAKVSDHGAAELMVDYHRRLAAGSAPAYALADALAAADEPQPFVCFGAGW
jgi:tetratricopeptide (TPR) repeat protein